MKLYKYYVLHNNLEKVSRKNIPDRVLTYILRSKSLTWSLNNLLLSRHPLLCDLIASIRVKFMYDQIFSTFRIFYEQTILFWSNEYIEWRIYLIVSKMYAPYIFIVLLIYQIYVWKTNIKKHRANTLQTYLVPIRKIY